jgi:hypothetical protein
MLVHSPNISSRVIATVAMFLAPAAIASASPMCPFMTQGSAAKLLGGDVALTVDSTEDRDGSCTFTHQQGALSYTLGIVVHKSATDPCTQHGTPLKAIGNEALECRVDRSPAETIEKVSGRVRDMYFTIDLTIRGPIKSAMSVDFQRDAIEQATEQVTGNLY